jgi:hypothetical protein
MDTGNVFSDGRLDLDEDFLAALIERGDIPAQEFFLLSMASHSIRKILSANTGKTLLLVTHYDTLPGISNLS